MKNDDRFANLDTLSDWQLVDDDQDIRGYPVRSLTGDEYGKIDEMLVDKNAEHVLAVKMEDGRLVAVEHLDIKDDHVIYTDTAAASPASYQKVRRRS